MMETMFKHYGIDWLAMMFTFFAIYTLGNKNRNGFFIMMLGNTSWIIMAIMVNSLAMVFANLVFFIMNVRGFLKWSQ